RRSCAVAAPGICAASGPGSRRSCASSSPRAALPSWRSSSRRRSPSSSGSARLLGLRSSRMLQISRTLGIRTVEEFRQAVADDRISTVPGIGPITTSRIQAALEREPAAPRGLTIDRGRRLGRTIAEALDGIVAGPTRRFCELSYELAVVCVAREAEPVLGRFERLASIVSVLARNERRATGVTIEGVPVTLVVARPENFGTELFRATGSPEFVAAHEPLPDARDEEE